MDMSFTHWVTHEAFWSFDSDAVRTDGPVFMPNPGAGPMIGQFLAVRAVAAKVLAETKHPMTSNELIETMAAKCRYLRRGCRHIDLA
jgi:hypothetical protein